MKFLKWFAGLFIIYAIGDIGKMYFSHSMSAIDKGMQEAMAEEAPKLPARDEMGLTTTRVSYNSPTLRRYITVPKGIDAEKLYKQKITDKVCTDKSLWMFEKGLRIENIFQQEQEPSSSTTLDLGMPDTTVVIDAKQCKHRWEVEPVSAAPAVSVPSTAAYQQPAASPAYEAPAVTTAAPAAASTDTAAAVN